MVQLLTFGLLLGTLALMVMSFPAGTAGGGTEAARRHRAARPIVIVAAAVVVVGAVALVLAQLRQPVDPTQP